MLVSEYQGEVGTGKGTDACVPDKTSNVRLNSTPGSIGVETLASSRKRLLAKFVNQMVAAAFEVSAESMLEGKRGVPAVTRARQLSIYLMHTCLSFSLTEIGRLYGKDRTTVGHACRVVEDRRDEPEFDDRVLELEEMIRTVLNLASNNAEQV